MMEQQQQDVRVFSKSEQDGAADVTVQEEVSGAKGSGTDVVARQNNAGVEVCCREGARFGSGSVRGDVCGCTSTIPSVQQRGGCCTG